MNHVTNYHFLDYLVHRNENRFECSVFRKDSFTGLSMSYFSNCSFKFKLNCIQTLLSCAYRVCSNYMAMHNEFCFLRDYFRANGFCTSVIDRRISQFLDKVFGCFKVITGTCVTNEKPIYFSFPYFGPFSEKLKQDLLTLLSKYNSKDKFCVILVNNFTIGSFFNNKDKLPLHLRSSLVYKYSCVQCRHDQEYVGMATHTLGTRVAEHAGISFGTGVPLTSPPHSAVRDHSELSSTNVDINIFQMC